MVGDKPLVQVKPKEAAPAKSKAAGKNQPVAVRLQECLDIDDGTKDRLNCYDAVIKPEPAKGSHQVKASTEAARGEPFRIDSSPKKSPSR